MVGGVGDSIETGESAYELIPGAGWITLPSLPSGQGRAGAKMVYDSNRGVMVLTGGAGGGAPNADSGGRYSDTWELWPSLFVSGQPSDVAANACGTATFSVLALGGVGPYDYQWRRDGELISDDDHFSGTRTDELTIHGIRHEHAGNYDVMITDSCSPENAVASEVATLTLEPDAEWVLRATPNRPEARFAHAMVYDRSRRVTVLFGGRTASAGLNPFNDLWEWDGERWTKRIENSVSRGWTRVPATGWKVSERDQPVRRAHCAMAYDTRRGRVVMFGGWATDPDGGAQFLKDLWEWDGVRWRFRSSDGPVARLSPSMAYDESRGRTVLFGGQSFPQPGEAPDGEVVWEWDGERWHTIEPPLNPSSANNRAQSRMTYDSFRNVVVFGPTTESYSHWSFWDWDGAEWKNFPVAHFADPIVTVLHGTSNGAFAFDADRRRCVWFGGSQIGLVNTTAFFDGKYWSLLGAESTLPPPQGYPAMAYDSHRRATVMFGGSPDNSGASDETWELTAVDLPVISEHPVSQYGALGGPATFSVLLAIPGPVSYQWHHGNTPIPGARSQTFTLANVRPEDAGEYRVQITNACGAIRSRPALLSLHPGLKIFSSGKAVTLIWPPDLRVVLETAENLIGPWTGIPDATSPFTVSGVGPSKYFRLR